MTQPALPTARRQRSLATQERLLAAARAEFQQFGLSGARVDRIAASAQANKRLIYVYFGDKESLFDTVVTQNLEAVVRAVPFDAEDLPGYAERLLDYWQAHPDSERLFWWRNLERRSTTPVEEAAYQRMVDDIAVRSRGAGETGDIPPAHLFAFVLALLQAWFVPSPALGSTGGEHEHARRRRSVREAVRRLQVPPPDGAPQTPGS